MFFVFENVKEFIYHPSHRVHTMHVTCDIINASVSIFMFNTNQYRDNETTSEKYHFGINEARRFNINVHECHDSNV